MLLKGTMQVDVEITGTEIASYLEKAAFDMAGSPDDPGIDWCTDNDGNTYLGYNWQWKVSSDPKVATLIDAAHIVAGREPLKMGQEQEGQ